MDYKKMIGEKVIRTYDKAEGVIDRVDDKGVIHIKYNGDSFSGGYLFDPFMAEQVVFANANLQSVIDGKIKEIENEQIQLINSHKALDKSNEKFFITMKNEDESEDIVLSLDCSKEEAYFAFSYVVKNQAKELRKAREAGKNFRWRQVKLFDARTGEKIAQES